MIAVCKHGNKIDIEFCQPETSAGIYRQTVKMTMCRECVLDATMEAMERACETIEQGRLR